MSAIATGRVAKGYQMEEESGSVTTPCITTVRVANQLMALVHEAGHIRLATP